MPQTLLALLALSVGSLIMFNQQRARVHSHKNMIHHEVELAATGAAMHILEMAGSRSFDEATTPEALFAAGAIAPPMTPAAFTAPSGFGAQGRGSEGCDLIQPFRTPACNDVDDLHGLTDVPVRINLSGGHHLAFTASLTVTYVTGVGSETPSLVPTNYKRVTLRLRSPHFADGTRDILQLSRVIAYDPVKADFDYENHWGMPLGMDPGL